LKSFFSDRLNRLAKEREIRGPGGEIWKFRPHDFRHTKGTEMINNKVPQHIVQKYLGHESPSMTQVYAKIWDETLKEEFKNFQGTMIDIYGDEINSEELVKEMIDNHENVNNLDAQWFKHNILQQALPNGTCALPFLFGANV